MHDKEEYVIQVRKIKEALNHGLVLKKVHRLIAFNQKAWLKWYADMNIRLKKNDFEKVSFKLMKNAVFGYYRKCEKT